MPSTLTADFASAAKTRLLVLDRVQDPGNIGTIIRSAIAFGWEGIFLLDGCCDPYGDKALRASRGASLRIPICKGNLDDLLQVTRGMTLYAAEPATDEKEKLKEDETKLEGVDHIALVLGSEGEGLSAEVKQHCTNLSIPMVNGMESLNVAIAGGILLFLLSNRLELDLDPKLKKHIEKLLNLNGGS